MNRTSRSPLAKAALFTLALSTNLTYSSAAPLQDMISPVTNPVEFEDPRHSTELRPLYVYHELDDKFVTQGGHAQVYALQTRAKILDDLSFIATKDGIVRLAPKTAVPDNTGFANVAAGMKYSFYRSDSSIATAGLRYEIPMGAEKVLQGYGKGMINPFVTLGTSVEGWNFMLQNGFRFRLDSEDSSFYDANAHVSYKIGSFYPLIEAHANHVMQAGDRLPIADEGQDFFNLGASQSAGETLVTMAAGARYRITDDIDLGAAYQFPVDKGTGTRIIDYRITTDMIVRF